MERWKEMEWSSNFKIMPSILRNKKHGEESNPGALPALAFADADHYTIYQYFIYKSENDYLYRNIEIL